MLPPEYLMGVADHLVDVYAAVEEEILEDIARRIVKMGYVSEATAWQIAKGKEAGILTAEVQRILANATGQSEVEILRLLGEAGTKALTFDDAIYKLAGLSPIPMGESPALKAILLQGSDDLTKLLGNFTHTRADMSQLAFRNLTDKAWLQVMSGAYDPETAIRRAINELARLDMSKIAYPSGHESSAENAVRRAVTTGVNQAIAKLQLARAEEMGCNLVEVTSHGGARPEHAAWQGKIYCINGKTAKYKNLRDATGYGTGPGLCGWNCYHNFYPYFEGLSTPSFSRDPSKDAGRSNQQDYENQQKQRYYERQIRAAKKECVTLNAAYEAADGDLKASLKKDFDRAAVKLKRRENKFEQFMNDTGHTRLRAREQSPGFGHSVSSRAVWAKRKANQNAQAKRKAKKT